MDSGRDWSAFNPDLLVEIAVRVPLIEDFMAFRGVCSSWRVSVSKDKFKPTGPRVPMLMLPWKRNENNVPRFYSLSKRKISMRLALPETKIRCFGVGFGWLLNAGRDAANLLNPLTRAQILLPNLMVPCSGPTFRVEFGPLSRAVLSADPSYASSFVMMVLFCGIPPPRFAFWRFGDKVWNEIQVEPFDPQQRFVDIAYYQRKFFLVDETTVIWVWDPFQRPHPTKVEMMLEVGLPGYRAHDTYMVESSTGELILITTNYKSGRYVVRIRRLDVINRQCELIAGLGNDAVFVGANVSTSVAASAFPDLIEPNRIYVSKYGFDYSIGNIGPRYEEGKNLGIYNVEDGSTECLVVDEAPPDRFYPPVWIAPSY